jgi:hypothetical protein
LAGIAVELPEHRLGRVTHHGELFGIEHLDEQAC